MKKKTCYTVEHWLNQGFTLEEAKAQVKTKMAVSPFRIEHWLLKGFTEEEAKIKIRERRPMYPEFWQRKGFSIEESLIKCKELQTGAAKKVKHLPEDTTSNKCYWMKRHGMTEEDAIKRVSERQKTFTLEKLTQKYGIDEGKRRFDERQQRWLATLNAKSESEKKRINSLKRVTLDNMIRVYGDVEIAKAKIENWKNHKLSSLTEFTLRFGEIDGKALWDEWVKIHFSKQGKQGLAFCASKESLKIFIPLYKWCRKQLKYSSNDIKIGITGSGEWFLRSTDCFYLYDFTIPDLGIIIEYNGEAWHPNPKWKEHDKEKWMTWRHPQTKEDAESVYLRDRAKIQTAHEHGFQVLELWSSDSFNFNYAQKFIKESHESKHI